jgi:hypothetical protein
MGDIIAALEQFGNKHLSNPTVSPTCGDCTAVDEETSAVEGVEEQLHLPLSGA